MTAITVSTGRSGSPILPGAASAPPLGPGGPSGFFSARPDEEDVAQLRQHQAIVILTEMSRRITRLSEGPYEESIGDDGKAAIQAASKQLAGHPQALLDRFQAQELTFEDLIAKVRVLARAVWQLEGALNVDDPLSGTEIDGGADPLTDDEVMDVILGKIILNLAVKPIPASVTRERKMYVVRVGSTRTGTLILTRRTRLTDAKEIVCEINEAVRFSCQVHRGIVAARAQASS